MQGVKKLSKTYPNDTMEKAFKRALDFNCIGYLSLKKILKNALYLSIDEKPAAPICGGFSNILKAYDEIIEAGYKGHCNKEDAR